MYDRKISGFRTPEINQVALVMSQLSMEIDPNKKADSNVNSHLSAFVPPTTHNLNDILEGTRDFARVWDLYGYLIKEA